MLILKNFYIIFYVIGIFNLSCFFSNFLCKRNFFANIVLIFLLLTSFLSIFFFVLIFSGYLNFYYVGYFNLFIASLSIFLLTYSKKNFFVFFKEIKKKNLFIFVYFFLILYLICLLPVSDPDSLDYHLGIPNQWILDGGFIENENWLHYRLASYGEVINLFSIISFDGKLLGFLKVTLLIFLTILWLKNFWKKDNLIKVFLASPIFLFFIFSQKPQFLGFLIFSIILLIVFENFNKKQENFHNSCIFILTGFISALNYSFLPLTITFLLIYIFYNKNFFLRNKISFFINIILFISIVGLIYYKNFYYHGNFLTPFFENAFSSDPKAYNVNFSEYLKNYGYKLNIENILKFPFRIFIPFHIKDITIIYGPLFIFIFFIKSVQNKTKFLFILLFLSVFIMMFTSQISNRYYFISYFIFLYLLSECSFKNTQFLTKFSNLIFLIFTLLLSFYFLINVQSVFLQSKKNVFLKKNVYQFEEVLWLNKIIKKDIFYTSDIRVKSLLDKNHITPHFLFYVNKKDFNKEFFNFIDNNEITLFSFVVDYSDNYFYTEISKCKKILYKSEFVKKRRNFLAPKKNIKREIFELDLTNEECKLKKPL